jgi:hypothetical protein
METEKEIIRVASISSVEILNKCLQPKIDQNKDERNASWLDAKDKIVK